VRLDPDAELYRGLRKPVDPSSTSKTEGKYQIRMTAMGWKVCPIESRTRDFGEPDILDPSMLFRRSGSWFANRETRLAI